MVKKLLKQSLCSLLFYSGIFKLSKFLSSRIRKRALILCYHRVVTGPPDSYSTPGTQLDLANFRSQMAFLCKNYEVISLSKLLNELAEGKELSRDAYAVLTFDDGLIDGYTNIFPLLKAFNVPATFFVSPWAVSTGSLYWVDELWHWLNSVNSATRHFHFGDLVLPVISLNDKLNARRQIIRVLSSQNPRQREETLAELKVSLGLAGQDISARNVMLTREHISEMIASGLVEVGAHSLLHPMLPFCTEDQMKIEVGDSKEKLEALLGSRIDSFAYPFGKYTSKALEVAQSSGYKAAVTTHDGFVKTGDNLYLLKRVNVFRDDTTVSLATLKIMRFYLNHILAIKAKESE